jgi:hypothetical protein
MTTPAHIEIVDGEFVVDAAIVGKLLDVSPADVPALMRGGAITSVSEHGIDVDQGTFRLTFLYRNRRARLRVDRSGLVLQRSVIDFGDESSPGARRGPVPPAHVALQPKTAGLREEIAMNAQRSPVAARHD